MDFGKWKSEVLIPLAHPQKSIIICSARMRCKDNEIMHNNKEKQPKSCIIRINCLTLPPKEVIMTYDSITEDGRLWAVKYDDCPDNALYMLFEQWNDVAWLYQFFKENMADLMSYFKITDVNEAIYDTIEDGHLARGGLGQTIQALRE